MTDHINNAHLKSWKSSNYALCGRIDSISGVDGARDHFDRGVLLQPGLWRRNGDDGLDHRSDTVPAVLPRCVTTDEQSSRLVGPVNIDFACLRHLPAGELSRH